MKSFHSIRPLAIKQRLLKAVLSFLAKLNRLCRIHYDTVRIKDSLLDLATPEPACILHRRKSFRASRSCQIRAVYFSISLRAEY